MINVIIIEDLADYRQLLTVIINSTDGFTCMGSYASTEEAAKEIKKNNPPHIALVDIGLPGKNGIHLVRWLKQFTPSVLCMICTNYEEDEKVFEALRAGANSYMLKSTPVEQIVSSLKELYEGGAPMSPSVARKVTGSFKEPESSYAQLLSDREKQVLQSLSKGLLYKEIAIELSIKMETVKRHCYNIYEKLHVNNRTEALNKYFSK